METAKLLREKRQMLRESQKEILAAVHISGEWNAEQREQFDRMDTDFETLTKDIERTERAENMAAERAKATPQEQDVKMIEGERLRRYLLTGIIPPDRRASKALQFSTADLGPEQRANVQTISTTGGGYMIDSILGPDVDKALRAYGGVLELAKIIRTNGGNPLEWPTTDDTTVTPGAIGANVNGGLVDINTAMTTNADAVVLGQVTLGAYKAHSGMLQIPRELLEDSGFDVEAFILNDLMVERVMRVIDYYLVLGTGATMPKGLTSGATYGETLTAAGAYTRTDLLNLVHSLNYAYRIQPNARLVMADSTMKIIRAITDDYGQPLYNPDPRLGAPDTVEGMKVLVNDRMAASTGGAKTIVACDLGKLAVRMVNGMRLVSTTERFIDQDQIGVVAFWRFDSDVLQSGAFKYGYESAT